MSREIVAARRTIRVRRDDRIGPGTRWFGRYLLAAVAGITFGATSATFGLETLVLSIAKLRYDNSAKHDSGTLKVRALVDDNSTLGQLQVGLLAGTVSLSISDSGQFVAEVPITGCTLKQAERVICRSLDRRVRAVFLPTPQGPFIYNMRVSARRLSDTVTGLAQPVGPVSVELHQPGADRPDVISTCKPFGTIKLVCRER
jgi:hypothetical protein